jgi:hypothetical protein
MRTSCFSRYGSVCGSPAVQQSSSHGGIVQSYKALDRFLKMEPMSVESKQLNPTQSDDVSLPGCPGRWELLVWMPCFFDNCDRCCLSLEQRAHFVFCISISIAKQYHNSHYCLKLEFSFSSRLESLEIGLPASTVFPFLDAFEA